MLFTYEEKTCADHYARIEADFEIYQGAFCMISREQQWEPLNLLLYELLDPPWPSYKGVWMCFWQVFLDPQATSVEIPWFLRYSGSYFPKPFENTPAIGNSEIYQQFQAPKNGGILTYISCTVIM